MPLEVILERFRLEDVQRSPAFFDIKKLNHMNGVYIRELPVGEFIAATRPWVDPIPGEWAPGGWRDPDTGAPAVAPPAWAPERFDAAVFAEVAAVTQERVTVLGEVPEFVDFLFLKDAPDDPDSWQKAIAGDEGARGSWPRRWPHTRLARGTRTRCTRSRWPSRSRWAASWARRRRRYGWR